MTMGEVIESLEHVERAVHSFYVKSEMSEVVLRPGSSSWEQGVRYYSGQAWIDVSKQLVRADIEREVAPAFGGELSAAEISETQAYNGKHRFSIRHKEGMPGKPSDVHRAEISQEPPLFLSLWLESFGTGLSASVFNIDVSEEHSISARLRQYAQKYKVSEDVLDGVSCLRVSTFNDAAKAGKSFWFDPARGWALLARETTRVLDDGSLFFFQSIKVLELKEVSPGLWYPIRATFEAETPRKPGWRHRWSYTASTVLINQPIDDSIFTPTVPAGYVVHDTTLDQGIVYTAGLPPSELQQFLDVIADQSSELTTSRPTSQPSSADSSPNKRDATADIEVLSKVAPSKSQSMKSMFLWVAATICIIVITLVVFLRRGEKPTIMPLFIGMVLITTGRHVTAADSKNLGFFRSEQYRSNCGVNVGYVGLRLLGVRVPIDVVAEELEAGPLFERSVSLLAFSRLYARDGLQVGLYHADTLSDVVNVLRPDAIIIIRILKDLADPETGHFFLITKSASNQITFIDPPSRSRLLTVEQFTTGSIASHFTGEFMIAFHPKSTSTYPALPPVQSKPH